MAAMAKSSLGQSTCSDKTNPRSTERRRLVPRSRIHPEANPVDTGPNFRACGCRRLHSTARSRSSSEVASHQDSCRDYKQTRIETFTEERDREPNAWLRLGSTSKIDDMSASLA